MTARLIDHTSEKTIAYCCRVSNPDNQDSAEFERLLRSCINRNEWSVLESSCAIVEFNTTRAISPQLLRHRSFTFQEFSQRWQPTKLGKAEVPSLRAKGASKHDSHPCEEMQEKWGRYTLELIEECERVYEDMVLDGIHPECARMVLPLATPTRIYVTGNMRSWYHYILLRSMPETQLEHRTLALQALNVLENAFPVVCGVIREKLEERDRDSS